MPLLIRKHSTGMASSTSLATTTPLNFSSGSASSQTTRSSRCSALSLIISCWRCFKLALNSRMRYCSGKTFICSSSSNKSAAMMPEPAPNSSTLGSDMADKTSAICRAIHCENNGETSGAVMKSPSAPNFLKSPL